ncbi:MULTISPECIES: hypothetical protein [Trichocoleus]|uniref:HTH merR-type domain-containing protein n=1 Tax=Trichocoleus desertorum GB2-A4 TaxID=2933944 RepID=A0ABV0JCV5_9CYAN|nr:hypothetical protein [Trichocoleus sp. FACHB-46]MBD1864272.1 hypothetical protein [Trichocoleus sp. FACHB-46]
MALLGNSTRNKKFHMEFTRNPEMSHELLTEAYVLKRLQRLRGGLIIPPDLRKILKNEFSVPDWLIQKLEALAPGKPISTTTFWRWRDAQEIKPVTESGGSFYTHKDLRKLEEACLFHWNGGKKFVEVLYMEKQRGSDPSEILL